MSVQGHTPSELNLKYGELDVSRCFEVPHLEAVKFQDNEICFLGDRANQFDRGDKSVFVRGIIRVGDCLG